jgi:perosamine synthetase
MIAGTTARRIPVSQPVLGDLEREFIAQALNDGAISGFFGEHLGRFETGFASYSDCEYGVAVTSGTAALHVALLSLGIGAGDEVLVSTLTNMATVFAILYVGARPVPIDIEDNTWNLDVALLEPRITSRTKAILVVHLFGHPVDMDPVLDVARRHKMAVIEDCAEAHGATYKGRKVGSLGDIGCFSFYANKIITTGEGGMMTTNSRPLAERARSLKSLAFGGTNKFMHVEVGYNYRMTNLQAALGCAQLQRIEMIIDRKRELAGRYTERLQHISELRLPTECSYARHVHWMYHLELRGRAARSRAHVMQELAARGVESREGFIPANMQTIFQHQGWTRPDDCPKAAAVAESTLYLPSGPLLSFEDLDFVTAALTSILGRL